jgi:predicted kinase
MNLPLLVIITGMTCTGKTTLSRNLAAELNLPLIAKDDIKERLFDSLGWGDREWSKKLGRATFDLLFHLTEVELKAGRSLMIEALFYPQYHLEILQTLKQRQPFRPLVIECVADANILRKRFFQRSESGERHPGHVDHTAYSDLDAVLSKGRMAPLDLGGKYVQVDTNDFSKLNSASLLALIQAEIP